MLGPSQGPDSQGLTESSACSLDWSTCGVQHLHCLLQDHPDLGTRPGQMPLTPQLAWAGSLV